MARLSPQWDGVHLDLDHSEVDEAVWASDQHGAVGATLADMFGLPRWAGDLLRAVASVRSEAMRRSDRGGGITLVWIWPVVNLGPEAWPYPRITSRKAPAPGPSDGDVEAMEARAVVEAAAQADAASRARRRHRAAASVEPVRAVLRDRRRRRLAAVAVLLLED